MDHPSERARNKAKVSDNLNVEIRYIATHLEEMALANDGQLTSLERRIDRFKKDFQASKQVIRD